MKRLFILGAALLAALVPLSVAPAQADAVTVVVEGCPVQVPSGANGVAVLDAAVASRCILSYSTTQYGEGTFLTCLNEVCGQNVLTSPVMAGTYWGFYINGAYASVGLDGYSAANLDSLLFTYDAYAY